MANRGREPNARVIGRRAKARLRAKAREDYAQARGTFHLEQLRGMLEEVEEELSTIDTRIKELERERARRSTERDNKLFRTAVEWVVTNRLPEIPGVGDRLARSIVVCCFDGTLESLRTAHRIDGVGYARQAAIDNWIFAQRTRIPQLVKNGFPGKAEIIDRYEPEQQRLTDELKGLSSKRRDVVSRRDRIRKEIERLSRVTAEDFYSAHLGDRAAQRAAEEYLLGLFAEWEQPPQWFRQEGGT